MKKFLSKINHFFSEKVLAWIVLLMSLFGFYNYIILFFQINYIHLGFLISFLGVIAAILMFNKKKAGLVLAISWAIVQIPVFEIGDFVFNLSQFFEFNISILDINSTFKNISINLLAIFLLYFLIQELRIKNISPEYKNKDPNKED